MPRPVSVLAPVPPFARDTSQEDVGPTLIRGRRAVSRQSMIERCRADDRGSDPWVCPRPWLLHLDVDALLRVLEEAAVALRAHREDLGEDRERGLVLRVRADVEAARAHDPIELGL